MTHDEAVTHFNNNLGLCRNAKEVTRLTYAVLPYLKEDPDTKHYLKTKVPELNLQVLVTFFQYSPEVIDVWYSANANIKGQLHALAPFYQRTSSGPHFCSGLGCKLKLPNAPSPKAPGLPRSPILEKEYQEAMAALNTLRNINDWWDMFVEYTPLWVRTAYSWDKPNAKQKVYLNEALESIKRHLHTLKENTELSFDHGRLSVNYRTPMWVETDKKSEMKQLATLHVWNAINAGQELLTIKSDIHEANKFAIHGFNSQNIPNVYIMAETLCLQLCQLYDMEAISKKTIMKYLTQQAAPTLPMPEMDMP